MHFSLLNQSRTDHPPGESHLDCITGLCVCPELRMFISSSLDGTVHIWNEENRLIRTLQLSAEPECMAYSGLRAELFLGIRGDLYRMNCARFLPHDYQEMLHCAPNYDHVIDLPIQIKAKRSKQKTADKTIKEKNSKNIIITDRNPLFSENMWRQKEYETLLARDEDLAALLQGTVMCKRRKPPSTEQTRKEAFGRYMKIVYGMPHNIKFDFDDMFDPDELAFFPEPLDDECCTAVDLNGKQDKPQTVETKEEEPVPAQCNVADFKSKTVLIEKSWHDLVPRQPFPKQPLRAKDKQILKEEPPQRLPSPREQPEPKKPAPPPFSPRTPAPVPPRTPTPEMPGFLKQFAEEGWFRDIYPDRRSIPATLSPDDFSLQLLDYLNNCSAPFKIKIVAVLQALHSQGLLKKTDMFYKGLIDSVPRHIRANMSPGEQSLISEILHLLVCLKSDSCDLVRSLLTLLAYNKYLWKKVLSILTEIGVHEAEQWLCPELESWDSELLDQSDVWKSLHERVEFWLELWTSKYKEHSRCQDLKSLAQRKPVTFTMVDVLNYFCSTQKEEYIKSTHVAPTGRKDTVLLPQFDCSSQAIHRLGENYSLARIRRPTGIFLPPLRNRPFLMCFPKFITLPLPRISLRPFHIHSDQSWPKASPHRYFILQQSYVEYYR
ncbi:uncharacterized protein LOC115378991 [Myripristis murdjan]|uniref:uncharacterized protein LOC115378991 n=1 Tax=Myripristis murdjan TaxID=586833 RepID=UPI0011763564|nr:uncharacterized protein LOC115378991 [Myripristis murdjan]